MSALPFALGFLLPPLVVWSVQTGGVWSLLPLAVTFGGVSLLDAVLGCTSAHADATDESRLAFRAVTWAWVPVQVALVGWAMVLVSGRSLPPLELLGLLLGLSICTGSLGITYAHELVHRSSAWERALGEVLLTTVSYAHFAVEHVFGHHRHVATPHDPATARLGESLFRFLPRTITGSVASAWRIEAERQRRRRRAVWHPANRMVRYGAVQVVMYAAVWLGLGPTAVALLAGQALAAVLQLEIINYIEHYGLERRRLADGRYEPVQPWHSWDSHHRLSNWLLINLARHADHHAVASRRYPGLRAEHRAPQLPAGYATMFLLALVPPAWRRVMDPRAAAWRAQHA